MSIPPDAVSDRIPPVAVPQWPGARHADFIEAELRDLDATRRDAMLQAVACAMDHYLAAVPAFGGRRFALESALDEALDDVLRLLPPIAVVRPGTPRHGPRD